MCKDLRTSWERFLQDDDESAFIGAIRSAKFERPIGEYPWLHRISDIQLSNKWYRVIRFVDEAEQVFIQDCDTPSAEPGVPYWLQGDALRRWIRDEEEAPAKGPIDWEQYR